jgi:MFS family permease
MLAPLVNRTYRHLFLAQVGSLLGTGLATVALGLLAYELAGADAGVVLGTALAIKMIAYVGVAPVVGAYAASLPRRPFLVALDLIRALVALSLPFVDQIWQIYVLIFVLQACSAAFTPTFQATIPDVLPDERTYTQALSLSRLAYDLESLISPTLAALLLTIMSFHWLFAGTAVGFVASALLVLSVTLPGALAKPSTGGFLDRTTLGIRRYLATPRLRGLLALNLVAAAGGAMVIVNTVVVVRAGLGGKEAEVALALAVFGGGSMAAALALPRLLDRVTDRTVMTAGGAGIVLVLAVFGLMAAGTTALWLPLHAAWLCLGLCYAAILTPGGRLLRRSSDEAGRPALFAAQFALSHACWLLTYPLAGWLGATVGLSATMLVLSLVALLGLVLAFAVWPVNDPEAIAHEHADLPDGHPHVAAHAGSQQGKRHAHAFVIDDLHRQWPRSG